MRRRRVIGSIAVLAPLLGILAVSVWFAIHGWMAIEGGAISVAGYIAMAVGVTFTLIVGVGLMSLVFYSHRHGYDDAADRGRSDPDE